MKKVIVNILLAIYIMFVFSGCKSYDKQEQLDGFSIQENMIYEDETKEQDSGKAYDKDGDGFVDGWY